MRRYLSAGLSLVLFLVAGWWLYHFLIAPDYLESGDELRIFGPPLVFVVFASVFAESASPPEGFYVALSIMGFLGGMMGIFTALAVAAGW